MNEKDSALFLLNEIKTSDADCGEVCVIKTQTTEVYYESGKVSMIRTNENISANVKVIKDNKKGIVSTNDISTEEAKKKIVSDALESAASAPEDDANGISDEPCDRTFVYGTPEKDTEKLYDRLAEFIGETKKKYPKISFDSITANHVSVERVYKNTNGVNITEKYGYYTFSPMYMAVDGEKTSSFNYSGVMIKDLGAPFMTLGQTEMLLAETEKQTETICAEGKLVGDIIVTPQCLSELLACIEDNFLSDSVLINGTSPYRDKLGQKIAAPSVTVLSAPLSEEIVGGYRSTSDGYIAENMTLIENGVLKNFVVSRYGSKRTGLPRSKNDGGCYIMNGGNTSLSDMIKNVKKGLIMNRFSAGSPSVNGDVTGVAKNSFLIEDGKIVGAVSETMFSGNLTEMLLNVRAISEERINDGSSILPWVDFGGVTISGK